MPGSYDPEKRLITLNVDFDYEPLLATATLIHFTVSDLLHQEKHPQAGFPDVADIAVIATGLGLPQANLKLVNSTGSFWDSTLWTSFPQPFLDAKSAVYAFALAAWSREEAEPDGFQGLPAELKRPLQKSLKYLDKTNDSFFQISNENQISFDQPQADWLQCLKEKGLSSQVIAIRHMNPDGNTDQEIENTLLEKFRSNNDSILLQCIDAAERLKMGSENACLLYTSPSPRDQRGSRMPSSA